MRAANNLASVFYRMDRLEDAEPLFRHVVEGERATIGSDSPDFLNSLQNLARTLTKLGRAEDALPLYDELRETGARVLQEGHPSLALYDVSYALCLVELERYGDAEPLLAGAIPRIREALGDEHRFTRLAVTQLAELYEATGRPDEAAPWRALLGE